MQTSSVGVALIERFEGLALRAYYCPAHVLTIGYGHTGADVREGQMITHERADALLQSDLRTVEQGVDKLVQKLLKQCQFDALVSFSFNVGLHALETSTLLRLLNAGKYGAASEQFGAWVKGGGKVLPGLVKRRAAEQALFLS